MSTTMPKAGQIDRKWYVIDAAGKPLGRVAAQAMIPSNSIGRTAMTRLRAYAGSEHKHAAQKPAEWNL